MRVFMDEFDSVFLDYEKILLRLKALKKTTAKGKEITHKDLRQAVNIMQKKHPSCRWKSDRNNNKRFYILIEGCLWLMYVYFQTEKNQIDADIFFFEERIKEYEELLKLEHKENFWNADMDIKNLIKYFNRTGSSIRKAIKKMCDAGFENYKSLIDDKVIISKEGVQWICKNVFKQKYLELLEEYKMQLTEKYIEAGYIYDQLFEMLGFNISNKLL